MEPMSEEQFYASSLGERLDYLSKRILQNGLQRPGWMQGWHFCVWAVNYGGFAILVHSLQKPSSMSTHDYGRLIFAKLMVWQHMAEAIGCRQGPLTGRMGLPNNWLYRVTTGTLKLPLIPLLGNKRTILDSVVNITFFAVCIAFLLSQQYTYVYLRILCACDVWIFCSDMSQFFASTGHAYWTMLFSLCFPPEAGQLAGVQLALIYEWFFSGVGKIGPWFNYVNGPFMLQSRLLRGQPWLFKLLVKSEKDLSPTTFGIVLAHTAAAVEYVAPICLMLPNWYAIWGGIIGITAMHVYILAMPAPFDVYSWNTCFMLSGVYLFYLSAADAGWGTWSREANQAFGFDWQGCMAMSPSLATILFAELAVCWYGQFFPNQIGYYISHRYWAGNWVQGIYMVKKTEAVKQKLSKAKTFEANPLADPPEGWRFFVDQAMHSALAYLWLATFNMKCIVRLVEDGMRLCGDTTLNNWQIVYSLPTYCCGEFRDQLYSKDMIPIMQREFDFDQHECFMIALGSFGCGRQSAFWKIIDMNSGVLAEGELSRDSMVQMDAYPSKSLDGSISLDHRRDDKRRPLLG